MTKLKQNSYLLNRLKQKRAHIVYNLKEFISFYRHGRIDGDVEKYVKENVDLFGYDLITRHSSKTGENIWYFPV